LKQSASDEAYWERLYRNPEYVYGTRPNSYLIAQQPRLKPGMRALAIGDGEGRNGVWLACQGLYTTSVDSSPAAVEKSKRLAALNHVSLEHECCDLLRWRWPQSRFDVVAAVYLHLQPEHRAMVHGNIVAGLKPGGLLVLEAFHCTHAGASAAVATTFYSCSLLRSDFHTLSILERSEEIVCLDEGPMHQGSARVVRLLAQKNT
jgi:2-polyprenyl-3-methyl-5-hydroxy-6-metoxy-1,4-benzoquinol methylase